ncbi:alanine racemase [Aestuariivirga litoralis]|uniref:Alanine racemase n=1 Tax=Aestuariivirga litoralis TaxID=2650924 RepID=A0A2W2CFN7_9HYPH|nr:alanine racemase [Aestuariivirga litoralis]PZF78953.1 alanine racemase [Aestuariivirga litoralis]
MTPTPEDLAGAVLTIDLVALKDNWRRLNALAGKAECGAAVKGNAYGLGIAPVARALWEAGCRSFFVARPKEGEELRELLPDATIYILDGLFAGQAEFYAKRNLCPALISIEEAREWAAFGRVYGRRLPCAIHVDTGINRLGFSLAEFDSLLADAFTMEGLNVSLLMSHLACADDPSHPLNLRQREAFAAVRAKLPGVAASLANSSGIFLGDGFTHDLVRPGIALYGGNPTQDVANPMSPVAILEGAVMQLRYVAAGDTVGYGGTWTATRPTRIAILGAGYKDGVPRALSSREPGGPAQVFISDRRCPVIGRISMDMMAIDITDLPVGAVRRGTRAEILGRHIGIDAAASWAGTISYELLTRLGSRYARLYTGLESDRTA